MATELQINLAGKIRYKTGSVLILLRQLFKLLPYMTKTGGSVKKRLLSFNFIDQTGLGTAVDLRINFTF